MVFEAAQFVVVDGVDSLLEVHHLEPAAQGDLSLHPAIELFPDIIVVLDVENLEGLAVAGGIEALAPGLVAEAAVHGLAEPDVAGVLAVHHAAGHVPEGDRDEGGHVAAEAVHHPRPAAEGLDLIVPEAGIAVVQVDDVGPVADLVAGIAVFIPPEEVRVFVQQHGIGRCVVVHHVDHALHAAFVDFVHQQAEVRLAAVLRVHGAVVAVGIGAAEASLPALLADGVDGHEPDDVGAEGFDAVEVGDDGAEAPLLGVCADIDGIDHLRLQVDIGFRCHGCLLSLFRTDR